MLKLYYRNTTKQKRRYAGFTIVELMIVTAIIVVLTSIAIPSYVSMRAETKARVCRANLRQIEAAIEQWSFEYDVPEGTSLSGYAGEIYTYLKAGEPTCPSGGKYILTTLGAKEQVVCSSGTEGHKLFDDD